MDRREFLKRMGIGTAAVGVAATTIGRPKYLFANDDPLKLGEMTYRKNTSTGDKVSLLGYGMMRLPNKQSEDSNRRHGGIDQEQTNRLVDFAIEHGVNYFDTAPVYGNGKSESATGTALSRHPRSKYFVATKLSNFGDHSTEGSKKMYHNSMEYLQVDYIDYYLLHSVGGSMDEFNKRFVDNGMLDFLMEERRAGRIRNLGFSFHGSKEVFDEVMTLHEKYHWDFVQIQMNYLDWKNAKSQNKRNVNAEYLYNELTKRNISVVIMEPLLGGRLSKVPGDVAQVLKNHEPEKSVASWAFRFCGTWPNVLTALSGMTYMEHLEDNLKSFSPLKPLDEQELAMLEELTFEMLKYHQVPCTSCRYCMPCPAGVEIPLVFNHYNKCIN
ncbi:MAG: aldo/keto reductase, partial [Prevotellaceae bacterium]|nr:aldo/keto reductase [Prevotellaceae bacterium]